MRKIYLLSAQLQLFFFGGGAGNCPLVAKTNTKLKPREETLFYKARLGPFRAYPPFVGKRRSFHPFLKQKTSASHLAFFVWIIFARPSTRKRNIPSLMGACAFTGI